MKVSIIVAVYNTSKYLKQCLDSVFSQTMDPSDYEVIIVNDCSTDNSGQIIREYVDNLRNSSPEASEGDCSNNSAGEKVKSAYNIKVIDKEVNEATFWSRVDGIMAAEGDYVGFVDSDDWVEPDMFGRMYERAVAKSADIVECGTIYEYEDENGVTVKSVPEDGRPEEMRTPYRMLERYADIVNRIQVCLYKRIFSRRVMDIFKEKYYSHFNENREKYRGIRNEDDLLLPLFIFSANNFYMMEESLCHHRAEIPNSTMDILRNDGRKLVNSQIFRCDAGFEVLEFLKEDKRAYRILEGKQINIIFSLLGKILETDCLPKEEAGKIVLGYVDKFDEIKSGLGIKDTFRFMHLKLKAKLVFK